MHQQVAADVPMDYQITYSAKRSTVAIIIKAQQLQVKAPTGTCERFIAEFVASKRDWIAKQLVRQGALRSFKSRPLVDGALSLFGQPVPLALKSARNSSVRQFDNRIEVSLGTRVQHQQEKAKELLLAFMADKLGRFIESRLDYWQPRLGVQAQGVKVRVYKRRWGSCDRRQRLTFNTLLAGAPHWVIDYVVVHELAHICHMDHGPMFWHLVNQHYEHTHKAKAWLREQGASLELEF
ncbi:SprT family zinc-dependent metalloprotease [Pseudoalteromonas sp. BDTF-M6]|uniref:M48 family metallopeptidase n=1 Tax=Pseudoalteromonas sp. BDTF-M6 TaxID=2796132 RepID=UPI001BB01978|nr:M48 family metallopeptidase [Pseudoalteromonas sp. BDTF-M6]